MLPDKTGLVVPGHDSAALSEALEYLISHPQDRKNMGREARRYMEARSFDAAFLQTWESYKNPPAAGGSFRQAAGF
jgi:glycosyltransferase involved in cell wall biosynthesis